VLKKRETLRQLIQSLQLRLSPDLQCDLQQGSIPPTPVMPHTSNSAEMLNPVAAASGTDSADLIWTNSQQRGTNEHKLSDEADACISVPMLHAETIATPQLVTVNTAVANDGAVDASMPATDETSLWSVGVCQGAPASSCTAITMPTQDASDNRIVFEQLVCEQNCNKLAADVGRLALSADVSDAKDKSCIASGSSSSSLYQVADTASCVVHSVSHGSVPWVNESLVVSSYTELQKSAHEHSGNDS